MEETADTEEYLGWQLRSCLRLCSQAHGTTINDETAAIEEYTGWLPRWLPRWYPRLCVQARDVINLGHQQQLLTSILNGN
jgi:hypothetical protein